MKLALHGPGQMVLETSSTAPAPGQDDSVLLRVCYCAICRTDAKMWHQGHRDLVLPRVPGHEVVAVEEATGAWYTLWPGQSCGHCWYCANNRENLCDSMQIIGFHSDGGFADTVEVPRASLVPIPEASVPYVYCFAEPVACIVNGFSGLSIGQGTRLIIYGGGVLGLLAALAARALGAEPVVVEQSAEKIDRATPFIEASGVVVCKETVAGDFDCAINACDSPAAFSQCLTKLRKGGQFAYFSGVQKDAEVDCSLLNLIHYRELSVVGSYGPRREHVVEAAAFCRDHRELLDLLVEAIVAPDAVPALMPTIFRGQAFKYIIDFTGTGTRPIQSKPHTRPQGVHSGAVVPERLMRLVAGVQPVAHHLRPAAQKKIDLKTKPLGALGRVEPLAVSLSVMQNTLSPRIGRRRMFVFAGDHGVVEEGVSAYPGKVTVQMVENFLAGGAAINVFCGLYGIELRIVDMGVKGNFAPHPLLIEKKVAPGTRNFALGPAMSREQAIRAIENGAQVIASGSAAGQEIIGLGEMGIGNTTAATAVISAITGKSPSELAGRGTGIDNEGLRRKIEVLDRALAYHRPDPQDAVDILTRIGGFELGGICGAVLAAAGQGTCVVLDGIISTAAGLLAYLLCPQVKGYLVSGHRSVETGQQAALDFMGLEPVLDMGMRLGEGTGAAMTIQVAELAARVMCDMASFAEAGVDTQC